MDPGVRSPLVDFFRRGEVARDVRLEAARGALAPRALDQLALLLVLMDDADPEVAGAARQTLAILPRQPLQAFLARTDVPAEIREWFARDGILPSGGAAADDDPLIDAGTPEQEPGDPVDAGSADVDGPDDAPRVSGVQRLATMNVMQRMKVAMRGTREERAVLIRDPNRLVAAAVLSSPKLSENEVESIARMANVGEEVLRVIGTTRAWIKSYTITAGLVRNPKTPVAISLHLLARLTDRDVRMLTTDRNVPEPLRMAARKKIVERGPGR